GLRLAEGISLDQSGRCLIGRYLLELTLCGIERLLDLVWIVRLGITQQHLDRRRVPAVGLAKAKLHAVTVIQTDHRAALVTEDFVPSVLRQTGEFRYLAKPLIVLHTSQLLFARRLPRILRRGSMGVGERWVRTDDSNGLLLKDPYIVVRSWRANRVEREHRQPPGDARKGHPKCG